uniref:BD-FAE-like domain-containing protein n=1 Tax=Mucochytrium quahogii TaxID=96639 RepID=A0A7S2RRG7_9STRA|mmetsp:Transcript_13302/g.21741  ORF Transcript_13302/g.21741 Transcript_13302/m.21741 type:complete len:466 (+) Transcript_13302:268-1665(+)
MEQIARFVLRASGSVVLFRLLAFDGLCMLPRQPFSWVLMLVPGRVLYVYHKDTFHLFSWFNDADITPALLLSVYLTLLILGGFKSEVLWGKRRLDKLFTIVLFVLSPLGWFHRYRSLTDIQGNMAKRVVETFGNASHGDSVLPHAFSMEAAMLNTHGETRSIAPNLTRTFKRVVVKEDMVCRNGFLSFLPGENVVKQSEVKLRQGLLDLDVYFPHTNRFGTGKSPIVIFVHGGGWRTGDKAFLIINSHGGAGIPHTMLDLGFTIVAIRYRPICAGAFGQDMVQDISDSISFIENNAVAWKADPKNLIMWGISAGGHLSLLVGSSKQFPNIKGIISFYAPTEILAKPIGERMSWYERIHHWLFFETVRPLCKDENDHECYASLSPVSQVHKDSPPTLILHGADDPIVPIEHARKLGQALTRHGVKNVLLEIPCSTHNCDTLCSSPCSQAALYAIERFLFSILALDM